MGRVEIVNRSSLLSGLFRELKLNSRDTAIVAIDMHRGHLDMDVAIPGHVLLGTDYPYDMGMEHPVDFIGGAGFSASKQKQIMVGNAARLLKIGYNSPARRRRP